MLSCSEIIASLEAAADDPDRLTIMPSPEITDLAERGATSLDLRLGRWFKSFKQSQSSSVPLSLRSTDRKAFEYMEASRAKEHFVPFGEPFILHPGRFVLGVTLEWIHLPGSLSGYVTGKSTLGRHGLVIETAAGIHPHFLGCLTLELANVGEVPIEIAPGMKICQIFLHRVRACESSERGAMAGRRKPSLPAPKLDPTFEKICVAD